MRHSYLLFPLLALCVLAISQATAQTCSQMSLGRGASLHGLIPFPADNLWNQDISTAPVDPNSGNYINEIGASAPLHPDFGAGLYNGQSIGIPYIVVSGSPFVTIGYTAYGSESDPGPMPVPKNAPIEGYPKPGNGDRHVLVLDRDNCWLYELYYSFLQSNGSWHAGSGAVWDLLNDENRPYTWTSADAAGLPIFPGLARYDEVAAGAINHALRFTVQNSQAAFTPPASHWAANSTNQYAAVMGMRLRLKASYDISGFPPQSQVILAALKKYGMIMADNGTSIYISGDPDNRWSNNDLGSLKTVPASAFEVLQINPLYTQNNVPTGPLPHGRLLHRQSFDDLHRPACNSELERHGGIVFRCLAASRSGQRKFGGGFSHSYDYIHALLHERLRPHKSHRESDGPVAANVVAPPLRRAALAQGRLLSRSLRQGGPCYTP